jgi:site-specific recombinase XerD
VATAAIGMPQLHPHGLRHSLASEIVSRGDSLVDAQEALHHDAMVSSRRCAHLYPERMKAVLSGIGRKNIPTHPQRKAARQKARKAA